MDPNMAMDAARESARALTKFEEIMEKVLGPRWTKKQADADAYADQKRIQTIRENPDMEIVYVAGALSARERTPEELMARASTRIQYEAIQQQNNIESVLQIAEAELKNDSHVSEEQVDEDWITRLFNIVKDVSSEEMQFIWGKILAGEIKEPNSFSLRTLETIRNLSRKDAETFQKILPLIIEHNETYFMTSDEKIFNEFDIQYRDILLLGECGLLNDSSMLSLNIYLPSEKATNFFTTKNLMIIKNPTERDVEKISIALHPLSSAGKELFKILLKESNTGYLLKVAEELFEKNKKHNIEISIHSIIERTEDGTRYVVEPIRKFTVDDTLNE